MADGGDTKREHRKLHDPSREGDSTPALSKMQCEDDAQVNLDPVERQEWRGSGVCGSRHTD
jgi:hypothetical protein